MKEMNIEININVNNVVKYAVGNKIFELIITSSNINMAFINYSY